MRVKITSVQILSFLCQPGEHVVLFQVSRTLQRLKLTIAIHRRQIHQQHDRARVLN